MSAAYFYYDGAPGTRFCYSKEPTFVCRYSQLKVSTADEQWSIPDEFTAAAKPLGMEPGELLRLVVRGHRNNRRRMRVQGRLTDRCDNCGAKMERLGFRCWIERDKAREHYGTSDRMTEAFGGSPSTIDKVLYIDTKKEARAWALENSQISQSAAKEGEKR